MFRLLVALCALHCVLGATDEEIRNISARIWEADANRFNESDVQYNINGPKFFTFVNEERFKTGTWPSFINLFDSYEPDVSIAEPCGTVCRMKEEVFLDAIMETEPILLLQEWLVDQGLGSPSAIEFRSQLRQYWFMLYTRSGGPLGSSGFEHVFVGEIKNNAVSGFHNWANMYFSEKDGVLTYGPYLNFCEPEILLFGCRWLGYNKPITSSFLLSSPEVEIAIGTLCLLTRIGSNCPIRLGTTNLSMTVWDMTGIPKTIGTSYPNC